MTELSERTTAGRVHVVRHSFEPSTPFQELIEDFAGSYVRPGFLLRSTKEVYVDSATYIRGGYRDEDKIAQKAVEHAQRRPFVIGRAAMHFLYAKSTNAEIEGGVPVGYRMFFAPVNQASFDTLAASLDSYPSTKPRKKSPLHHYLYLDLPLGAAFIPDLEEAKEELRSTLADGVAGRLFSAAIVGIRSKEVPLVPEISEQSEESNHTTR